MLSLRSSSQSRVLKPTIEAIGNSVPVGTGVTIVCLVLARRSRWCPVRCAEVPIRRGQSLQAGPEFQIENLAELTGLWERFRFKTFFYRRHQPVRARGLLGAFVRKGAEGY